MDIRVDLYSHQELPGSVDEKLELLLTLLTKGFQRMANEIAALETKVAEQTTVIGSAVTLLDSLHTLLVAAQNDPARMQSLIDQVAASKDSLAAAVAQNTPAATP